ncbi:7273_t:CDS:2, partial [Paraglomus brasilianum]
MSVNFLMIIEVVYVLIILSLITPLDSSSMTSTTYTLICQLVSYPKGMPFSVEIGRNMIVDKLKKLIKAEKSPQLNHIAADELTLWKVEIPYKEKICDTDLTEELNSLRKIFHYWETEPPEMHIHVLVGLPPDSGLPNNTDIPNLKRPCSPEFELVKKIRQEYIDKFIVTSPSSTAHPSIFFKLQERYKDMPFIRCGRPSDTAPMPIDLFHPIFYEFLVDIESYKPTPTDLDLAVTLMGELSSRENNREEERANKLRNH